MLSMRNASVVPSGTSFMTLPLPGVETPGYSRVRYGALPFWFSDRVAITAAILVPSLSTMSSRRPCFRICRRRAPRPRARTRHPLRHPVGP